MGVSDVVRGISMMVGFEHPDIEDIVKGYFINYEMKCKQSEGRAIVEYEYEDMWNLTCKSLNTDLFIDNLVNLI